MKDAFVLDTDIEMGNHYIHTDLHKLTTYANQTDCCSTINAFGLQGCEALPGESDGAHSVGVAEALRHTSHLTAVTVHLPHTH